MTPPVPKLENALQLAIPCRFLLSLHHTQSTPTVRLTCHGDPRRCPYRRGSQACSPNGPYRGRFDLHFVLQRFLLDVSTGAVDCCVSGSTSTNFLWDLACTTILRGSRQKPGLTLQDVQDVLCCSSCPAVCHRCFIEDVLELQDRWLVFARGCQPFASEFFQH